MRKSQREKLADIQAVLRAGALTTALQDCLTLREETRGDVQGWKVLEVLAELYKLAGDAEGAASALWQAAQEDEYLREQRRHYSGYLFALHYLEGVEPEALAGAHRQYADLYREAEPLPPRQAVSHARLRIGYLAPCLSESAVMRFAEPLLTGLPSERFEVWAYSLSEDRPIEALQEAANMHYVCLAGLDDAGAAELIRRDEIDILMDLGGHSAGGRTLFILAQRPAPLQLSGIGYFDTLGLPEGCVDGFLTDACLARPGEERLFAEPWWELPQALVFRPDKSLEEARRRLSGKAESRCGGPVLGVWQNLLKVTDTALDTWGEILQALPESRLIIRDALPIKERAEAVRRRAEKMGLPVDRVQVEPGREDFLPAYGDLDLVLDTFPYPGGYMTAAALYLGVPVVTMAGDRYGSRFGASLLQVAGRPEWIAGNREEYVRLACGLAGSADSLRAARQSLWETVPRSALLDTKSYLENLAESIESLWRASGKGLRHET